MRRLNGWQRLGLICSPIVFIGCFALLLESAADEIAKTNAEMLDFCWKLNPMPHGCYMPSFFQPSSQILVTDAVISALAVALIWFLPWTAYRLFHWVRAGFP